MIFLTSKVDVIVNKRLCPKFFVFFTITHSLEDRHDNTNYLSIIFLMFLTSFECIIHPFVTQIHIFTIKWPIFMIKGCLMALYNDCIVIIEIESKQGLYTECGCLKWNNWYFLCVTMLPWVIETYFVETSFKSNVIVHYNKARRAKAIPR